MIRVARQVEEVVVDVAVAVHQRTHRAGAFEGDPLAAVREPLLEPAVMDAPAADEEIEIVQAREIRRAFGRLRRVLGRVGVGDGGENAGDQCNA